MLQRPSQTTPDNEKAMPLYDRCRALEKEISYYKSIVNDMITPFFQMDRNGILTMANKHAAYYLGGTPDEVTGKSLAELFTETDADFLEIAQRVIDTGTPVTFDRKVAFPFGQRWLRAIIYPVSSPYRPDRLAHFEAVDITEEKTFQEELTTTERRRVELEGCLRKAQKMDAIGTLAGGIAHDFNNILSSIIGYTELAMDDLEHGTLVHENLGEVLAAGMRAKDLIAQILTFSRQTEQQMRPVPLHGIVREVTKMLRATVPTTIEIDVADHTKHSTVFGDATQLHQVVLNLCTNAVYAMGETGGTLDLRLDQVVFDHDSALSHEMDITHPYLKLTVSDTGGGISPDVIDRIFEPYTTTKPSGQGTGLGLAVVHGIVRSHKGHIEVKNHPGRGTTMEVFFPLLQKQAQVQEVADRPMPKGTEHILVVDDEPQIVHMYRQALERLGYTVSARTSSLEALEAFKAQPENFHAVLTDMTMPNLTGDRLAQQIKYLKNDIPVILCTGYGDKMSRVRAKTIGIDLLLMKPVGWMDLAEALRFLLDRGMGSLKNNFSV